MTYVSIAGQQYPATITGRMSDKDWDGRSTKAVRLEMTHADAVEIWNDGAIWSIITENTIMVPKVDDEGNEMLDENGAPIMVETVVTDEFDNSDYCIAGDITDHRDGMITVKMGKLTELEEAYEIMFGGN